MRRAAPTLHAHVFLNRVCSYTSPCALQLLADNAKPRPCPTVSICDNLGSHLFEFSAVIAMFELRGVLQPSGVIVFNLARTTTYTGVHA